MKEHRKILPVNKEVESAESTIVEKLPNSKHSKCTPKAKKAISISIAILLFLSIAAVIALWQLDLLEPKAHSYTPPRINSIIYGSYAGRVNGTDHDQDDPSETIGRNLSFIILDLYNQSIIEMFVVNGFISKNETSSLITVEANDTDFEDLVVYQAFVNVSDGSLKKLLSSNGTDDEDAESISNSIKMLLLNSEGEKMVRTAGSGKVCEYYGLEYCPNFSKSENKTHTVLIANYSEDISEKHRRLSESNPLIGNIDVKIKKRSYINNKSGNLDAASVKCNATIAFFKSADDKETTNFTLAHETSANFTLANFSLTETEKKMLKIQIMGNLKFKSIDLLKEVKYTGKKLTYNESKNKTIPLPPESNSSSNNTENEDSDPSGDDSSSDPSGNDNSSSTDDSSSDPNMDDGSSTNATDTWENNSTSSDDPNNENSDQNRYLYDSSPRTQRKIFEQEITYKLFRLLGINVNFEMKLNDNNPNENLKATSQLAIGPLSLELGSFEVGGSAYNMIKRIITLKNIFEKNIKMISDTIENFTKFSFKDFNLGFLEIFSNIMQNLQTFQKNINSALEFINSNSDAYAKNALKGIEDFKSGFQKNITMFQEKIADAFSDIDITKSLISSTQSFKEKCIIEYASQQQVLSELINKTLVDVKKVRDNLLATLDQKLTELSVIQKLQDVYTVCKSSLQLNFNSTQAHILRIQTQYEFLSVQVIAATNDKIQLNDYMNGNFIAFKTSLNETIYSLNKQLVDINTKIDNEVTKKKASIELQIQLKQNELDQILLLLRLPKYGVSDNELIIQRDKIIDEMKTLEDQINGPIATLNNQLLANLSQVQSVLRNQYNSGYSVYRNQVTIWKTQLNEYIQNKLKAPLQSFSWIKANLTEQISIINETKNKIINTGDSTQAALDFQKAQLEIIVLNRTEELLKYENLTIDFDKQLQSAQTFDINLDKELNKTLDEMEQEFQNQKIKISSDITNIETQLDNLITSVIPGLQIQIAQLQSQLTSADQSEISSINDQIKKVQDQIDVTQLLIALMKDRRTALQNTLNSMITSFTSQLPIIEANFSNFISSTQKVLKLPLVNFNKTLNDSTAFNFQLSSQIDLFSQRFEQPIAPNLTSLNNVVSGLQTDFSFAKDKVDSVNSQISNATNILSTLNTTFIEIESNFTKFAVNIVKQQGFIEATTIQLRSLNDTFQTVLSGNYNWTEFFNKNGLINVRELLENKVKSLLDGVYNDTMLLKKSISSLVSKSKNNTDEFLKTSDEKSSELKNTMENVNTLPKSESISLGFELFDFSVFDKFVKTINDEYNQIKKNITQITSLLDSSIPESLNKLKSILDSSYYTQTIQSALENYKTIERLYKVKLDYDGLLDSILDYIIVRIGNEMNDTIISLTKVSDIGNALTNFAKNSLVNILNSQIFKGNLMTLIGKLGSMRDRMFYISKSYRVELPPIPTPFGPISTGLDLQGSAFVDRLITLSFSEFSFSIIPGASLSFLVYGGWNFFLGDVGVGAKLGLDAILPVTAGFSISASKFFVQGTLLATFHGSVGVYYRYIRISIRFRCRRWRCRLSISISRTSPSFIVSVGYSSNLKIGIIPYTTLG